MNELQALFAGLERALAGAPALAVAGAVAWGIASVVLSPCHLATVPVLVAFGAGARGRGRSAALATLALGAGVLATLAAMGGLAWALGRSVGTLGAAGTLALGGVLLLFGLVLLDVVPLPWSAPAPRGARRDRGLLRALGFGAVLGTGLGPCTFAFLAPVLAATFRIAADRPGLAATLLGAFAVGHTAVFVLAGVSAGWVQGWLDGGASRLGGPLRRLCGVLVIGAGLWVLWTAP